MFYITLNLELIYDLADRCSQVVFGIHKLECLQTYLCQVHHVQNHALHLIGGRALDFKFGDGILVLSEFFLENFGDAFYVVYWGHEVVR